MSIVLLYEIGVVGSAIGADVAYLIYVPAHFWICKRMIGLPRASRDRTFAPHPAGGGVMAPVMLAFGHNELSLADWFLGAAAGRSPTASPGRDRRGQAGRSWARSGAPWPRACASRGRPARQPAPRSRLRACLRPWCRPRTRRCRPGSSVAVDAVAQVRARVRAALAQVVDARPCFSVQVWMRTSPSSRVTRFELPASEGCTGRPLIQVAM